MTTRLAIIAKERAAARTRMEALHANDNLTADEDKEFSDLAATIKKLDEEAVRIKSRQEAIAATAQPVADQTNIPVIDRTKAAASVETDPYVKSKSLVIGAAARVMADAVQRTASGHFVSANQLAATSYGENHPVTRALNVSTGAGGGFIVPPDFATEIIELLRPVAVVRAAGPRNIPMPNGTMTLPGQASAATAYYGTESAGIIASQPGLKQIIASYKKLTALVPVTNDMLRYANPATDAFVRDDIVRVIGLREDLAFLLSDGSASSPLGFLGFANRWVSLNGGTVGVWSSTAASTLAVNGTDPANSTGGNFITSNAAVTLTNVVNELGGAINRLDTAQVPDTKRVWFMAPRTKNYLLNVQNSLGVYVFRDELTRGMLLGYPVKTTTQIPTNIWDAAASNKDLSFVFLAEMDEAIILDSMQIEIAVSREGTYIDGASNTVSAFTQDQTIIRAITEHDFQLRHDQSVAVIQGVRWAPAIG